MIYSKEMIGGGSSRPLAKARDYRWLRVGAAVEVEGDARVGLVAAIHHTSKSGEGVAVVVDYGGEGRQEDCDVAPLAMVSSAWPAWCVRGAKVWAAGDRLVVGEPGEIDRTLGTVATRRVEIETEDEGILLEVAVWYEGTGWGEVVPLVALSPASPDLTETQEVE